MKIRKTQITTNPLVKTVCLNDKKTMYVLSETDFGGSKLISEEELQQIYEYRSHQIACEYVQDMYPQFTDEELTDYKINEVAHEMHSLTEKEGLTDCEALEKVFEMRAERQDSSTNSVPVTKHSTKNYVCEVVRDFDGTYYANISVDGTRVSGLPEYVNYRTLKKAIKEQCELELPPVKDLEFQRIGRKFYARFSKEEEK